MLGSAPTRGPWIEIPIHRLQNISRKSAPTRGPWIEIPCLGDAFIVPGRPPHGGRGLKFEQDSNHHGRRMSAPTRGPWIEILTGGSRRTSIRRSAPTRGPWIEILSKADLAERFSRRPPHGGRGLKSCWDRIYQTKPSRPPHGGRGLK